MAQLKASLVVILSIFILSTPVFARSSNTKIKWVFIGDSYTVYGETTHTSVPDLVAEKINLRNKEYNKFCKKGYGFKAIYNKQSANFISLIEKEHPNTDVKNVVVIGGIGNDLRTETPINELAEAMNAFFCRVKELYPNATIWYAMPNWAPADSTEKGKEAIEWQYLIKSKESLYLKNVAANGVHILRRARTALRFEDNRKCFYMDYRHPTLKGRKLIAEAIYKDISKSKIYRQQREG